MPAWMPKSAVVVKPEEMPSPKPNGMPKSAIPVRSETEEATFDPEGSGYDYESAKAAGLLPDSTGHWPSREPKSGLLLKGHTTLLGIRLLRAKQKRVMLYIRKTAGIILSRNKNALFTSHGLPAISLML